MIELEAPQLRHSGLFDRTPSDQRRRINPRAVALAVRPSDALVVAAAGAVAYGLRPAFQRPPDLTAAFTVLAVMAMLVRFPNAEPQALHDTQHWPLSRRLADGVLRALLPFVFSILVVIVDGR